MSVPARDHPIRRRIKRAARQGLAPERIARLWRLPPDFVRRVIAGPAPKAARRMGVKRAAAEARAR